MSQSFLCTFFITALSIAFSSLYTLHAEPAPTVDGYRGIWFTLGQFSEYGDKYSGGLGTYTSSHNPVAVYAPEVDKTFFTYGGIKEKEGRHLVIMASYFDHKTHSVPKPVIVCDKNGVNDPHDNGSLQIDHEGFIWIFVSGRGKKRPGFIYKSDKPFSIDGFTQIDERELTYPQPWLIKGQGWLHLFTKYSKGRELYFSTGQNGADWLPDVKLAGMGGHYQVSESYNNLVGSYFNYHPNGNVDRRTNIYYVQTKDFGKTWTNVRGETLKLPLEKGDKSSLVVDYEKTQTNMYACDLTFDAMGRPIMLYVTSQGWEPGPGGEPRALRITKWDGKQWSTADVAHVDHNYDMGSLWVDGKRWSVIAPTEPGPQAWGSGGELSLWTSTDQGKHWKKTRAITDKSRRNHNYVRRPRQATDPFFAFWADGNPDEFSESHLYFCDSTGTRVWKLPYDMDGDTAKPIAIPLPKQP